MPIPELPKFEEVLSKIQLSTGPAAEPMADVELPWRFGVDEKGEPQERPAFRLHYSTDTEVSFESLVAKIGKELAAVGHPGQKEFGFLCLAMMTLLPRSLGNCTARTNRVIGSVCKADVNLYFVLFADLPRYFSFAIPPFWLGPLRIEKLRYQSDKADSDFYSRYARILQQGSWSIEREPLSRRVLNIGEIRDFIPSSPVSAERQAWGAIVDAYFSTMNAVIFDEFWSEFIAAQDLVLAFGGPSVDPRHLRSILRFFQIAIFLNLGSARLGFVAPSGSGLASLDLANAHVRVPRILGELRQSYGFEQFDASALHGTIRVFAKFIARARRHQIDGRLDEALLHYVIALELVFAERKATLNSVSERAAAVTFCKSGRSFSEQQSRIEKIYDLRSRYVHAGQHLRNADVLDEVHEYSTEVLRCLMRIQARQSIHDETVLVSWLRNLDFIAKGEIAQRVSPKELLREAGIL